MPGEHPRPLAADPKVADWRLVHEDRFDNRSWTEECQGVAHDANAWYFSSNAKGAQRVVRLNSGFAETGQLEIGSLGHAHLGDIDVRSATLYGALEGPPGMLVAPLRAFEALELPAAYSLLEDDGTPGPQQGSVPWCAYDPVTARLYSSPFDDVGVIYAYRIDAERRQLVHDAALDTLLEGNPLMGVQGGAITPAGNVILVSHPARALLVYRLSDGHFWGSLPIAVDTGAREELEGVDVRFGVLCNGVATEIHVVLLDNDVVSRDDVIFKHYSVPNPNLL